MKEYGIFSPESSDYNAESAIEAGFWSEADASDAMALRYGDDECHVHECEDEDVDEDAE